MLPQRFVEHRQLDPELSHSLASLGALEGLARSSVMGVLPLITLDALGTKSRVSIAYFVGAALAFAVTLNLGTIERLLTRKWTVTAGLVSLAGASVLFAAVRSPVLALGIGMQAVGASTFAVGLSLYIMDFIDRRDLTKTESQRVFRAGGAWFIGPFLGVWLWENVDPRAPFVFSVVMSALTIAYFWYLRLSDYPVLSPARSHASNPRDTVPRFLSQKSLRISYVIVVVRAMFWIAVFVYGPIYIREAGMANWVSGAFLSGTASLLFFAPFVQRMVERRGVRWVVARSFAAMTAGTTGLAVLGSPDAYGLVFWTIGAVGAGALDVVGNVPFMRLVKPGERVPMTTVFSTWRQVSALVTPAIAALVLIVFPFAAFFAVLALLSVCAMIAASYLPRRLA